MLSDEEFRRLLNRLERPWGGYRKIRKGVKKRVRRHMVQLGCTTIEAYLDIIDRDAAQWAECKNRLLVTISRFFRDRWLWERLGRQILPDLFGRFPDGLRAWSAGCANGEEPYTLSMIYETIRETVSVGPPLNILATDARPECLNRARGGLYPLSSLREVPEAYRSRWFAKAGRRLWRIDSSLQTRISWRTHQLLDEPPHRTFHIILLRNNLLTYYQGPGLTNAYGRIVATLAKGGILVTGSRERLPESSRRLEGDPACRWVYQLK